MASPTEKIAFIGAGNMASAIIAGLIDGGYEPTNITASDLNAEQLHGLADAYGIKTTQDNNAAISDADVIMLAVKPQVLAKVTQGFTQVSNQQLVISIAAGVGCESLSQWLGPTVPIVRCMPNTPALVRVGACGLFANAATTDRQRAMAEAIMSSVGVAVWLEHEEQMHAVTAVSGSGPAYFFYLMEAMIEAATNQGLSEELACKLTIETALGAATLAKSGAAAPKELRQQVTSPNGTTEQAVLSFDRDDLRSVVERAMDKCAQRSITMGDELGS